MSENVPIRAEVGARIRSERQRLGLNQAEFGRVAAVSRRTQAGYEAGEGAPGADYLAAMAARGVDILYVVTGRRDRPLVSGVAEAPSGDWTSSQGFAPEELDLVESFRRIGSPDRAALRQLARSLADRR